MKLEFLAEGSLECPLIRLFEYRGDELEHLRVVCTELADGRRGEFVLHDQPWIEPINGCRFTWRIGATDVGVSMPPSGAPFVLELSDEAWRENAEKLLALSYGYNWLTDGGDVEVLVSRDGQW